MAEAIVVTIARKKNATKYDDHLRKLEVMLWGGAMLLGAEHLYNGEYIPSLYEMATAGVAMSLVVTLTWLFTRKKSKIGNFALALIGAILMVGIDLLF